MTKKNRTNPRRRPATMADVAKAKQDAFAEAVRYAMAIMLTVLVDKFNGRDYLADVWREVNDLSDSVTKGYVSVPDLIRTLRDEYSVSI